MARMLANEKEAPCPPPWWHICQLPLERLDREEWHSANEGRDPLHLSAAPCPLAWFTFPVVDISNSQFISQMDRLSAWLGALPIPSNIKNVKHPWLSCPNQPPYTSTAGFLGARNHWGETARTKPCQATGLENQPTARSDWSLIPGKNSTALMACIYVTPQC